MQKLKQLNLRIYKDVIEENSKKYKSYEQQLHQLHHQSGIDISQQNKNMLSVAYYNLSKLSNRPKYIKIALELKEIGVQWVQWNLQKIALTSARDNHIQAYQQAIGLIQKIMQLIEGLNVPNSLEIFVKEVKQILAKECKTILLGSSNPTQVEIVKKFETECPLVSKKFHIADIMAMEAIDPRKISNKLENKQNEQKLFYYLVFLSIACFTRATQKYYCHETSDRHYHLKAIEIGAYFYHKKSVFMRFLNRTYCQHYRQALQQIREQDQEHGQLKFRVQIDPQEVRMPKMPWQMDEQEYQYDDNMKSQSVIIGVQKSISSQIKILQGSLQEAQVINKSLHQESMKKIKHQLQKLENSDIQRQGEQIQYREQDNEIKINVLTVEDEDSSSQSCQQPQNTKLTSQKRQPFIEMEKTEGQNQQQSKKQTDNNIVEELQESVNNRHKVQDNIVGNQQYSEGVESKLRLQESQNNQQHLNDLLYNTE